MYGQCTDDGTCYNMKRMGNCPIFTLIKEILKYVISNSKQNICSKQRKCRHNRYILEKLDSERRCKGHNLPVTLQQNIGWNITLFCTFMDFDPIYQEELWKILCSYRISIKTANIIKVMYNSFNCSVMINGIYRISLQY